MKEKLIAAIAEDMAQAFPVATRGRGRDSKNPAVRVFTISMRRDELEGALSPLVSFKSIMHAAGQCSTDVDAGDVADVMDALLMNTFHRVGVPGVMGL